MSPCLPWWVRNSFSRLRAGRTRLSGFPVVSSLGPQLGSFSPFQGILKLIIGVKEKIKANKAKISRRESGTKYRYKQGVVTLISVAELRFKLAEQSPHWPNNFFTGVLGLPGGFGAQKRSEHGEPGSQAAPPMRTSLPAPASLGYVEPGQQGGTVPCEAPEACRARVG